MSTEAEFRAWLAAQEAAGVALEDQYQSLAKLGLLNRVRVHSYVCEVSGCQLATVVRLGNRIVMSTRDYKLGPGMNVDRSVPRARERNTLDGERHWPGHVFDVSDLAEWGPSAGTDLNCRDRLRTVRFLDVLATVGDTPTGKPGRPSLI